MNLIRFSLLLLVLLCFNSMFAVVVRGYIVTNKADTVFGTVKLSNVDRYNGTVSFGEINTEPLHAVLLFKEDKNKHFTAHGPKDILGFGFVYKSGYYRYRSFNIITKSLLKSERIRPRFLKLCFSGKTALYNERTKENRSAISSQNHMLDYYDYYLFSDKRGLIKVTQSKQFRIIADLLHYFDFDPAFIARLSASITFRDIHYVLYEYEKWMMTQHS